MEENNLLFTNFDLYLKQSKEELEKINKEIEELLK